MNSSLSVTAIITDEVTAVEIKGVGPEGWFDNDRTATGWSKKHPRDDADPEISFNLAMARALQELASKYAQQAADIAGFPIEVELDAAHPETGTAAALVHFPAADPFDLEEEVVF